MSEKEQKNKQSEEKQLEVYKVREGEVVFDVDIEKETIWATQEQISKLFDIDRTVIGRHLRNIFRDGELEEERVCAKNAHTATDGKTYLTKFYNLDAIISVGYRVNSRKATDFRIWATKVLHNYLVDGVAVNERRIKELDEKKLRNLEGTLGLVKRLMMRNELTAGEAKGILEVISKYSNSFKALKQFDEGRVVFKRSPKSRKMLGEIDALKIIDELRKKTKESEDFGKPNGEKFKKIIGEVYRKNDEEDVYKTVAERAGELLYLVVRKKPFSDGNKRIGALLFIVFLTMNDFHLTESGETKISDRALTALTLLISESEPEEKDLIIALICKMLEN